MTHFERTFNQPVTALIRQRFSCRTYTTTPIAPAERARLEAFVTGTGCTRGPLGSTLRLRLIAAGEEDRQALKGLGTYGFIRNPAGFILGAVERGPKHLEDFGYQMEQCVLYATDLGLGTCWLGGSFSRSSFSARLNLTAREELPAVVSTGYIAEKRSLVDRLVRNSAQGDQRLPWTQLFFAGDWGAPLSPEEAGAYAEVLEMVRRGPSASNKQPWRIIKTAGAWHFYLQRTPGYASRNRQLLEISDMQRVDMGIAMCHFALTAEEAGLVGRWAVQEPALAKPDALTEYIVSWLEA